jgi:hypothetical protein
MDGIRSLLLPWSNQSKADRRIAYKGMHALAGLLLSSGKSAILDATYGPEEVRQELSALSARAGLDLHWIQCRVSPEVAVQRFLERGEFHPAVDLNEGRVRRQASAYPYLSGVLTVNTELSVETLLPEVEHYLRFGRPLSPQALFSESIARAV